MCSIWTICVMTVDMSVVNIKYFPNLPQAKAKCVSECFLKAITSCTANNKQIPGMASLFKTYFLTSWAECCQRRTGCETHQRWRWDCKKSAYNFKLARHEDAGWETMFLQSEVQNSVVVTHHLNTEVYWNKNKTQHKHIQIWPSVSCLACV